MCSLPAGRRAVGGPPQGLLSLSKLEASTSPRTPGSHSKVILVKQINHWANINFYKPKHYGQLTKGSETIVPVSSIVVLQHVPFGDLIMIPLLMSSMYTSPSLT